MKINSIYFSGAFFLAISAIAMVNYNGIGFFNIIVAAIFALIGALLFKLALDECAESYTDKNNKDIELNINELKQIQKLQQENINILAKKLDLFSNTIKEYNDNNTAQFNDSMIKIQASLETISEDNLASINKSLVKINALLEDNSTKQDENVSELLNTISDSMDNIMDKLESVLGEKLEDLPDIKRNTRDMRDTLSELSDSIDNIDSSKQLAEAIKELKKQNDSYRDLISTLAVQYKEISSEDIKMLKRISEGLR